MSGCAAYLELPSGERIEIPAEMPDVTEADGTLWDGSFELPESVKKLMEWADEAAIEWDGDSYFLEGRLKPRRRIKLQPAGALGGGAGQTLQHIPAWTVQLPI